MRNFRLTSYSKNEKELMNSMPLTGPSTYEEAVTRIEQAEREMDADDGASWEEVLSEAKDKVNNYANLFIEKTNQCGNKLLKYPHIGHPEELLADRKRLYRTISINTNYRLIYHVTSTTIWIVDVWDRRRDPLKLTKRIK